MVKFDDDFRKRMKERMTRFSKFDALGNVSSKIRVKVVKGDNLVSEAKPDNQDFSWKSDESGPSPLSYFISSLAMCQMIHYGEHAGSLGLEIEYMEIDVEGEFSISRPRSFSKISYSVKIDSRENAEKIMKLAKNASSDCYITNTLARACEVSGTLVLNGDQPVRIGS